METEDVFMPFESDSYPDADQRAVVIGVANRVALDILSSRAGVEALRHIADAARVLAGARYAALGVASADGSELEEFITVGLTPRQHAAIGALPQGLGVLGVLLHRTEPLRIDVLAEHPASVGFPPNHPPMDSFLGVPIRRGDTVLGSLYLTNKVDGSGFTEADEIAVQALGAHAAVAIHNLHTLTRQRALVRGLLTAQEEERRNIAFDLHDGLTQYVMASHAHLEAFRRMRNPTENPRADKELEQALTYLKEAVVESRRLVNGLRSLALDDLGLAGAVEQLIRDEKNRAGWEEAIFNQEIGNRRYDRTLETSAYRVVQEALSNVRKHAGTRRVEVSLTEEPDDFGNRLKVEVRDWGCGFNVQERTLEPDHFGLHGITERAHLIGGRANIQSAAGKGTLVTATFPVLHPANTSREIRE